MCPGVLGLGKVLIGVQPVVEGGRIGLGGLQGGELEKDLHRRGRCRQQLQQLPALSSPHLSGRKK